MKKSKKKPAVTLKSIAKQLFLLREDVNRLTLAVLEPEPCEPSIFDDMTDEEFLLRFDGDAPAPSTKDPLYFRQSGLVMPNLSASLVLDAEFVLIPTNVDVTPPPGSGNPHFCVHANECPTSACPCPPDCYCEGRTCPSAIPIVDEDLIETPPAGYPPAGYQLPKEVVVEVSEAEAAAIKRVEYENWARKYMNDHVEKIRKDGSQSKDVKLG